MRRLGGDSGSGAVTIVLLTPVMVVLLAFAVYAGRLSTVRQDVVSAARDAARAASVRQYAAAAQADGRAAAEATLAGRSTACAGLVVAIDTSGLAARGSVTATVTCQLDNSDVIGLGMPGSRSVSHTSTVVVDDYRGGGG